MNNLIPFSFEKNEVRVITNEDGTWEVIAKDIIDALGIIWDGARTISHVPEEWRGSTPTPTPQGRQMMLTLTEEGLYFLIGRSNKPKALPFQKWVFGEVVPSIRKYGSYKLSDEKKNNSEALELAEKAISLAKCFGFEGNMALISANNFVKRALGVNVLEYMEATHLLADQRGIVYTPTELGKLLSPSVSAINFNKLLEYHGLQVLEFKRWIPTEKAKGLYEWADVGKKNVDGAPVKQLRWFKDVLEKVKNNG